MHTHTDIQCCIHCTCTYCIYVCMHVQYMYMYMYVVQLHAHFNMYCMFKCGCGCHGYRWTSCSTAGQWMRWPQWSTESRPTQRARPHVSDSKMPYTGQLYRTSTCTCTYLSWFSKNIPKPFPIPHVKRSLRVVFGGYCWR